MKSESKVDVPKLMGSVKPIFLMYFIFVLHAKLQETLQNCQNMLRSFFEKILFWFLNNGEWYNVLYCTWIFTNRAISERFLSNVETEKKKSFSLRDFDNLFEATVTEAK